MKLKSIVSGSLILVFTSLSYAGSGGSTGVGGGGNFTAADFIATARDLKVRLTLAQAWPKLGVTPFEYERAVNETRVFCAVGESLKNLAQKKFDAFYEPKNKTILLNCDSWKKDFPGTMHRTLFHEYMRVLGKETSSYEISSKLPAVLPSEMPSYKVDEDLRRAIDRGDLELIYNSVHRGAHLNDSSGPAIYEVVSTEGGAWAEQTINGAKITLDSQSGPILSVDKKIALIYFLKSMGADPNAKIYSSSKYGHTAIHATFNPVVMETLLKVGADPLAKTEGGEEALIGFLFGYADYPNKPYFRRVVKYLLDLGADPKNCFSDGSSCVLPVAQKRGDAELVQLIQSYIH
jgi:hypothetical protein